MESAPMKFLLSALAAAAVAALLLYALVMLPALLFTPTH